MEFQSNTIMNQKYQLTHKLKRKHHRSELGIVESIMQNVSVTGQFGMKASNIATSAGLVYEHAIKICQKLSDAKLLESWRDGRLLLYRVTPKGLEFLSDLRRMLDLARSVNLQC